MEKAKNAAGVTKRADLASVVFGAAGWASYLLGFVLSGVLKLWLRSALTSGHEPDWSLYGLASLVPTVLGCIGLVLHAAAIIAGLVAFKIPACSRRLAAAGIGMAVLPCCAAVGGAILLVVIVVGLAGGGTNFMPR